MNQAKFSVNSLLIIIIAFSALLFCFMLGFVNLSYRYSVNDWYYVEGTDIAVRYSSLYESGIYQGKEKNTAVLRVKGDFGYEWGNVLEGKMLYLNEYTTSTMEMIMCKLVRVDIDTFEKETLYPDMLLRGRCASGEIVCITDFIMPANHPGTNALSELYAMTSSTIDPGREGASVVFIDPKTGDILYKTFDEDAFGEGFEARWLDRTLEEVMK